MANRTNVLFLPPAEFGQANIVLAMTSEFLKRDNIDLHIASFSGLEKRVAQLQPRAADSGNSKPSSSTLTFHLLDGLSHAEALYRDFDSTRAKVPPSMSGDFSAYGHLGDIIAAWSEAEYMSLVNQYKAIIKDLDPDAIIVDMVMAPAIDACRGMNRRYCIGSPMAALEVVMDQQGWFKRLFCYPAMGSGIPFPISWSNAVTNLRTFYHLIKGFVTNVKYDKFRKYRAANGFKGPTPLEALYHPEVLFITPSIAELDFPFTNLPNVHLCGPLVLDAKPVEEVEPKLAEFLSKGPTILINLGSHLEYDENDVRGVLIGLTSGLPQTHQAIWKLPHADKFKHIVEELLGNQEKERFWITHWLDADPIAIEKHANLVASVNHGGANSFFEAALIGIPQIILPVWFDTYENASRAEYSGVGIYGNKASAPGIDGVEFGAVLYRLLGSGKEAAAFKERARYVGEKCSAAGGTVAAADAILADAKKGKRCDWGY